MGGGGGEEGRMQSKGKRKIVLEKLRDERIEKRLKEDCFINDILEYSLGLGEQMG